MAKRRYVQVCVLHWYCLYKTKNLTTPGFDHHARLIAIHYWGQSYCNRKSMTNDRNQKQKRLIDNCFDTVSNCSSLFKSSTPGPGRLWLRLLPSRDWLEQRGTLARRPLGTPMRHETGIRASPIVSVCLSTPNWKGVLALDKASRWAIVLLAWQGGLLLLSASPN